MPKSKQQSWGWRLGFGAIQLKDGCGSYTNSVTGKASAIYLAPDGTRHNLAQNAAGVLESYDGSYLQFAPSTQILSFPNGTQMLFGAYACSANELVASFILHKTP